MVGNQVLRDHATLCNDLVMAPTGKVLGTVPTTPKYNGTDWLTRVQAAEHLGVSMRMLQYFREWGQLTPQKNTRTGRVRYRYLDVEKLRVERLTAWERDEVSRAVADEPATDEGEWR